MATYQFSALADGQAISFSPNSDILRFDQTAIAAADIRVTVSGSNVLVTHLATGKDVTLLNVTPLQLATSNVTFANGSLLLFGDNTAGTAADNNANSLTGTAGNDLLQGFGGADTMSGGAGNDTYIVGAGDVLGDSGGVDTVVTDITWSLGVDFENLTMTGTGNITMQGNNLDNLIIGNSGNNTFNARAGNDTILAGSGNDRIDMFGNGFASYGDEVVDGGDGFDTIDFSGYAKSAIVVEMYWGRVTGGGEGGLGTVALSNVEMVITGAFDDNLTGSDGADSFDARAGNDTLWGAWGNDTLNGSSGNDTLTGGGNADVLTGGTGADHFVFHGDLGEDNVDTVTDFASGADKLHFDARYAMEALGNSGNFVAGDERFHAGAAAHDASDRMIWDGSALWYDSDGTGSIAMVRMANVTGTVIATDIVVDNGAPPGTTVGGEGNDSLTGTSGNDTIEGLGGDDTINGAAGHDSLVGGAGGDVLNGGDGNDTLAGWFSEPSWWDNESVADTLNGGLGDDLFYVDHADDSLSDAGGIDTVYAADMDWTLGAGFDNLVIYNDRSEAGGVGIGNDLNNSMSITYGPGRLEGRGGNDTLTAYPSWGSSEVLGGDGNDVVRGWGELDGGAGNDTLDGGGAFVFSVAPGAANADVLVHFESGWDSIALDGSVHTNIGFTGRFSDGDGRFYSAAGASSGHDADDRVVYDTSTGNLWYDADGAGAGAGQLIARLPIGTALAATRIEVVNAPGLAINGTAGNDSLVGTSSEDAIYGLAGNDTLDGGLGADWLDGGAGNDIFFVDNTGDVVVELENDGVDEVRSTLSYELPAWVNNLTLLGSNFTTGTGNELDNVLTGNGLSSQLMGGDGNDTLHGGAEGDILFGENGNDLIEAGAGLDQLIGGGGNDTLFGGAGDDSIWMGFQQSGAPGYGQDVIDGGAGNDWIGFSEFPTQGALTIDLAAGTFSNDSGGGILLDVENVSATGSADRITGDARANFLIGGAGDDTLAGGAGNDTLEGSDGNDTLIFTVAPSAANADSLGFQTGMDTIVLDGVAHGGVGPTGRFASGDARFHIGTAAHDSDDRVIYNATNGQLWYDADGSGAGAAQLIATLVEARPLVATDIAVVNGSAAPSGQLINGTAGSDTMSGGAGNDTMNGLGGNDLFLAGANGGSDTIDGGAGTDSIEFRERATSAVVFDFGTGTAQGGGSGTITFTGIERVVASNFNDTLTGTAGAQTLTGQNGADTLWGAGGADTLWGGGGNDAFIFREMGAANADRISDFTSASDKVQLDDAAFTSIGAAGNFASGDGRFWAAAGATTGHDANDRVIYNTSTGSLYYDADGNGSGAAQLIATFQGNPAIAATDITVI